jgi:hypothetical protein
MKAHGSRRPAGWVALLEIPGSQFHRRTLLRAQLDSDIMLDMKREGRSAAIGRIPRLTDKEVNVISQLISREKYGLELVAESDGMLSRNAIYVLLGRMEDKGLIEGREEATPAGESGPPRRVYKVTGHGQRALAAHEAAFAVWAKATR